MKPQTIENAKQMLEMLASGCSMTAAGEPFGVSRSTVDREVKRLVDLLITSGSVDDFVGDEPLSIKRIREEATRLLAAAQRFDRPAEKMRCGPTQEWLAAGIAKIRARSDNANRDVALACVLLTTGAKPIEIAKFEVRDYLDKAGNVRTRSEIRPEVAVNGKARPLHFTSRIAEDAVDAYLTERVRRGIGVGRAHAYRGLEPSSRLFLTEQGDPFAVVSRSARDHRRTCPLILATFRATFRRAGWVGFTAQQARQHVATTLFRRGADLRQLGELLGLGSDRAVRRLINERGSAPLEALTRDLV